MVHRVVKIPASIVIYWIYILGRLQPEQEAAAAESNANISATTKAAASRGSIQTTKPPTY